MGRDGSEGENEDPDATGSDREAVGSDREASGESDQGFTESDRPPDIADAEHPTRAGGEATPTTDDDSHASDSRADASSPNGRSVDFGGMADEECVEAAWSFVESVPTPTLAVDPDTTAIHAANGHAASLFGRDRSTLALMGLTDIGGPTTGDNSIEETFASVVASGGPEHFEWDLRTDDGERRRLAVDAHMTTVADREWLVVTLTDATARVRSEQSTSEQLRTLDAIASAVPMALFQCDAAGTLTRWNDRLATDTGYAAEGLSGRALPDLFDDRSRSTVADALAEVYGEGTHIEREATLLTRSGERTPYRLTVGPVTDTDGSPVGLVGVGEDRTEASLREERLAVLTRVLRHNFRNELNVVTGFTQQAKRKVDDPETIAQLDRVIDTAERLLHLGETSRKVERLLGDQPTPGPIPLASVVTDALGSIPATLRDRADIETDVSPGITVSAVDQLSDALAELVDNAIRHNDAERPRVHVAAAELPSESWVSLVVADDGPGIPPAERAVLTGEETPLDHASGLGLWYVNWVVTAAGGELAITESKGGGTRIELSLRTPNAG